jgi:transposase
MFVPFRHDPGHAQVDFGEALAVIGGVERKIHFFAMDLPHSDSCLVQDLTPELIPCSRQISVTLMPPS